MNPATRLLAVAADPQQAARARADGADLIDVRAATPGALATIQAGLPSALLWTGPADTGPRGNGPAGSGPGGAEPFDADRLAAASRQPAARQPTARQPAARQPADGPLPASVITAAAIGTWLGRPVIRSRHTRAARRAIDMTMAIAGTRPPARTIRGLA
ncbi:MAG TPA: hypothetical protein VIX86_05605 [Streptosporangiaceae bacterium]